MKRDFIKSLSGDYRDEIWMEAVEIVKKRHSLPDSRRDEIFDGEVTAFLALVYWYQDIEDWDEALAFAHTHIECESAGKLVKQIAESYEHEIKEFAVRNYKRKELRATAILGRFSFHRGRHPFWERYPRAFFGGLVSELLKLKTDDGIVLDVNSENEGFFLEMLSNTTVNHIDIMTTSIQQQKILGIQQVLLEGQITFLEQSPFTHPLNEKRYTKIYGLNRFGNMMQYRFTAVRDRVERIPDKMVELYQDWASVQAAIERLSDNGRAVIAVNSSAVLNQSNQEIREKMIRSGRIESVMALPSMIQRTGQPMYLVVISKDNATVRLIDGINYGESDYRLSRYDEKYIGRLINMFNKGGEQVRDVTIAELETQEFCLDPVRYIGMEQLTVEDAMTLDKLANISRGAFARARVLDELITEEKTNVKYLTIRDMTSDGDMASLQYLPEEFNSFCLEEGDIVMSRVAPFRIKLIHRKPETQIVANGNLYIIRPDVDMINTTYLYMMICSDLGQKQLEMLAKGNGMRSISLRDLKSIKIPVVSRGAQDKKAGQYLDLKDKLENLNQQCRDIEKQMTELINDGVN